MQEEDSSTFLSHVCNILVQNLQGEMKDCSLTLEKIHKLCVDKT